MWREWREHKCTLGLSGEVCRKFTMRRRRLRWEITVEMYLKEVISKAFLLFVRLSDTVLMFQGNI